MMKKEDAIKILVDCAKLYHENLINNNLLFVFGTVECVRYFESIFLAQSFMHLTGISTNNGVDNTEFYNMCIGRSLSPMDFELKKDGTTKMKLLVLPQVMNIHRNENIKHVTTKPIERLLAVFKKSTKDEKYNSSSCAYMAKGVTLESILLNEEIKNKIAFCETI